MGLNEWLWRTRQRFETLGPRETLIESAYERYAGSWRVGTLLSIPMTNIYEREWNVLIFAQFYTYMNELLRFRGENEVHAGERPT